MFYGEKDKFAAKFALCSANKQICGTQVNCYAFSKFE